MTLSEIEDAIRASLAANFTEESDMQKWADALRAERERRDAAIEGITCMDHPYSRCGKCPPCIIYEDLSGKKCLDGTP